MGSARKALGSPWRLFWRTALALVRRTRPPGAILRKLELWSLRLGTPAALRAVGARIGERVTIEPWLKIQNAAGGRCDNLVVGDHVYIGPDVLLDLASTIEIGLEATVAGRVSVLTHQGVGDRPLRRVLPRKEGGVIIGAGSYLGFGCTIGHGVVVGEHAVVVGIPATIKRTLEPLPEA